MYIHSSWWFRNQNLRLTRRFFLGFLMKFGKNHPFFCHQNAPETFTIENHACMRVGVEKLARPASRAQFFGVFRWKKSHHFCSKCQAFRQLGISSFCLDVVNLIFCDLTTSLIAVEVSKFFLQLGYNLESVFALRETSLFSSRTEKGLNFRGVIFQFA